MISQKQILKPTSISVCLSKLTKLCCAIEHICQLRNGKIKEFNYDIIYPLSYNIIQSVNLV